MDDDAEPHEAGPDGPDENREAVHGVRRNVPLTEATMPASKGRTQKRAETNNQGAVMPARTRPILPGARARIAALAEAAREVSNILLEVPVEFGKTFSRAMSAARGSSGEKCAVVTTRSAETDNAKLWVEFLEDWSGQEPYQPNSVLSQLSSSRATVSFAGMELTMAELVAARFLLPAIAVSAASRTPPEPGNPYGSIVLVRDDHALLGVRVLALPSGRAFAERVRKEAVLACGRGEPGVFPPRCMVLLRSCMDPAWKLSLPDDFDMKDRMARLAPVLGEEARTAARKTNSGGFTLADFEDAPSGFPDRQRPARDDQAERPGAGRPTNGRVVFPVTAKETSRHGRDIAEEFRDVTGRELPLLAVPDLGALRGTLIAEFPHASSVIDGALRELGRSRCVRMRPTLLLGKPGSGKTTFARRLLEELGVPLQVFPCGGVADSGLTGCDRKWSTGTASVPVDLVRRHRVASPGIVLDEITRVGTSKHNGNVLDELVGLLEPESSCRWRDPYLAAECDLSAVLWLATANTMEGMDAALRDRFRIVRFPDAGPEHLAILGRSMALRQSAAAGLDARWFRELDADEMGALAAHWHGGSLRKLDRLVEAVLGAREGEVTLH
jgi:hypothetical protein